ncbi:MAG: SpoIIE family protein phosphatase [Bacteroidetes bacterium]|nr:SpoIIE family protein phosphatase [Bacteroidota bacterium]
MLHLWLGSGVMLLAQNQRIDSLEHRLAAATNPVEQSLLLIQLFDELEANDPQKALLIAKQNRKLVYSTSNFSIRNKMDAENHLGIAFMNLNQSDSALFYFQRVLNSAFDLKDSAYISKAYNNMGALNGNLGNYTTSMFYMNKSAEIDEALHDIEGAVFGYINIGSIYSALHVGDSARFFLNKGLSAALKNNNQYLAATCYINLGFAELHDENYVLAKTHFFDAYEQAAVKQDYDLMAVSNRNLAGVFQAEGKYKIAVEYDLKSLKDAEEGKSLKNEAHAHVGLAASYEKLGDFRSALDHFKSYKILTDSLREKENATSFIEMQERYKADQTVKENEILVQRSQIQDLEIAKNAEEIQNSRIIIISSVLGLILLIVLATTLYNRNVLKQRANLRLQQANEIIQEKNSDILASIEYASKIQEALLPTKDNPELFSDSFFMLRPKDIVSGDFLWYTELEGKKIIAAVDCTGHGVPGAFMSMIGNTFLHQIINERGISRPAEILNELRKNVVRALNQKGKGVNRKDGMDMAICCIDETAHTLEFAGANNPLFLIRSGEVAELKGDKQPVGYFEGKETPFTNHTMNISPGDCVYLFSDGFVDQFGGPKGKKFKYKQFIELLQSIHKRPMVDQKNLLNSTFDEWKGSLEQVDDVCVIGVRL